MYRFIAATWDENHGPGVETARLVAEHIERTRGRHWALAYKSAGLSVWHSGAQRGRMQACRLNAGRGVVLGRLFRNADDGCYVPQNETMDSVESARCLDTRGRHLADHYWGRFVAFLRNQDRAETYAMRDPSGAFPCYVTDQNGVQIFFSDMEDVKTLPRLQFSVNDDYLAVNVMLPQFQKTMTGLREVSEVLPAQTVTIGAASRTGEFVWNPFEVAARDPIADPERAALQLRRTVQGAVSALAGDYGRVLHSIGGLDSSIVLSCLMRSEERPVVSAVNFMTRSPRGDERYYCRQAAEHAGVPLEEHILDPERVNLSRVFTCGLQPSPAGMFDITSPAGGLYHLAEEANADAIFTGVGGDNVFFQTPFIFSALDYARFGFGSRLSKVVVEASQYGNKSLLRVLKEMLKERFAPEPCFPYMYGLIAPSTRWPFVNPDIIRHGPRLEALHPLLVPDARAAKGKYFHILASALISVPYYDQWLGDYPIERIHPLLSQPVVEACLRIPSWTLVHGGIDRGLARIAFKDQLAPAVARRTSKSNPDGLYEAVYRDNRRLIRDVLLDGELVRRGLLLRAPLEAMLADGAVIKNVSPAVALEFFNWEVWTRRWAEASFRENNDRAGVLEATA